MGIIYCVDTIPLYGNGIVIIERLDTGEFALVGGKQEQRGGVVIESLSDTAVREVKEETGLSFIITETLVMRAEPGRDPRGHYVSAVLVGIASGTPRDEPGKTRVYIMRRSEIEAVYHLFGFDHADILRTYFRLHNN